MNNNIAKRNLNPVAAQYKQFFRRGFAALRYPTRKIKRDPRHPRYPRLKNDSIN